MLNITFAGNPLHVSCDQLKVGDYAPDFSATLGDLSSWALSHEKGVKILSVVPSLDTGVCQKQTLEFNKRASALPNVKVITVSLDLPFAQARWCGAEGIDKLIVVSDYKEREFANKYGLLIDELKLLTRAVLLLDANNKICYLEYLSEITEEPNYELLIEKTKRLI